MNNEDAWREAERRSRQILEKLISLSNEIIKHIDKSYPSKRLYNYRLLSFGYLSIGKSNAESILLLTAHGLSHQLHYINRNMVEMVVNLHYIGNDDKNRAALTQRYFDYKKVSAYKEMKIIEKYPDIFSGGLFKLHKPKKLKDYDDYNLMYGKKNIQYWSGKNIFEMIDTINDPEIKKKLLFLYELLLTKNNQYLHPSVNYLKDVLNKETDKFISEFNVMFIGSTLQLLDMIIHECLNLFPKGRPKFRTDLAEIYKGTESLNEFQMANGLL